MVRVKLNDGTQVLFEMSWDEMKKAFDRALAKGHSLDVQGANGKVWAINPAQISYFEVVEPAASEAAQNGDATAEPGLVAEPVADRSAAAPAA